MSWAVRMGDEAPELRVTSGEAIKAAVTGIFIGSGFATMETAEAAGREALLAAQRYTERRRKDWRVPPMEYALTLDGSQRVWVRSTQLPEDPAKRCDGMTPEGNRCGRSLNHIREC